MLAVTLTDGPAELRAASFKFWSLITGVYSFYIISKSFLIIGFVYYQVNVLKWRKRSAGERIP